MKLRTIAASFTLLLIATGAFAQDGKPTREQTIEFILDNCPETIEYLAQREDGGLSSYEGTISVSIDITGTKVTVSTLDVLKQTLIGPEILSQGKEYWRKQIVTTFDLKDIEQIGTGTDVFVGSIDYERADLGAFPLRLIFHAANGKPLVTETKNGETRQLAVAYIPVALDTAGEDHQAQKDLKASQLFKAFEHLRKLSGAPQPLRFD